MAIVFDKVKAQAYWASYLINGDTSGLSASEKLMADNWLYHNGIKDVVDCGEESHFTWNMRLWFPGLDYDGGDVLEYTVAYEVA